MLYNGLMKKFTLLIIIVAAGVLAFAASKIKSPATAPTPASQDKTGRQAVEVIATDLTVPWDIDFLPAEAGSPGPAQIVVTERPGNLLIIGQDKTVIKVEGVRHIGEGGLLGLAVHPDFKNNNWVYLYFTSGVGGRITNRIERYRLLGNTLTDKKIILENIAGSSVHDGGQVEFGPDGLLYITTGDAGNESSAQDRNSLNGKILRLRDDGSIPADNPFGTAVYSYGHRNPQGLAWDDRGRLWAAEHGRSGIQSGLDELNLIEKGKNYGWPAIQGDESREGMVTPVINSGAGETWAPSGLAFFAGRLFFAGLRGQTLYAYNPQTKGLDKYFAGEYGRLRAVKTSNEGLYFTTSNRDGRGQPKTGDDKLILIRNPEILE